MAYISPAYAIDCRSKLAEMVVKVAPKNMGKVFFTLGGADANENAIKNRKAGYRQIQDILKIPCISRKLIRRR